MKNRIVAAVLLLGTVTLGALGLVAELGLLPETSETWMPWAFVAFGVLLLIFAGRFWPRLMAWAFKQEEREGMK